MREKVIHILENLTEEQRIVVLEDLLMELGYEVILQTYEDGNQAASLRKKGD